MQKESGVPQTPEGMPPVMERPLFRLFLLKTLLPSQYHIGDQAFSTWAFGDTQDPNSSSNYVTVCTVLHTRGTMEMSSFSRAFLMTGVAQYAKEVTVRERDVYGSSGPAWGVVLYVSVRE